MTYVTRTLLTTLALLFSSGCTVLPERSAKQTFMLPSTTFDASEQPEIPMTLRILTPQTESPLTGTSILVSAQAHSVQAYGGARWSKSTPLLVRDFWIDGLRQIGAFRAIISHTSDAASDLSLSSDLTVFLLGYPSDQENRPTVVVQVDAQLLTSESGEVLAAKRFRVEQSAQDAPVTALVRDFGSANQALLKDIAAWLSNISRGFSQETGQAMQP